MTSPVLLSESKTRRQSKIHRLSKKSEYLYSDYYQENDTNKLGGKRSVSLTTLQQASPVIEPRMAQLETLEAKMASIEVSLSTAPRRKKNGSISGGSVGGGSKISIPRNDAISRELENLRHALRDKENVIQSLKGQLNNSNSTPTSRLPTGVLRGTNIVNINGRSLNADERKQIEERLQRVKSEMDNKRLAIKNLKIALERLDITDNIDVRIQQAELEYQLGREELNALSLLEEARALQLCLEDVSQTAKPQATLYSCTRGSSGYVTLHAVEVKYDAKSPRFGATQKDNNPGLFVDWALDDTELCKGDRVIEVNGKLVLNKTKEDMLRLLAVAPDPAQIVILRHNTQSPFQVLSHSATTNEVANLRAELGQVRERAEEAQRMKEGLKTDNLRLTHRISYLEEQVAELLQRKNQTENQQNATIEKQNNVNTQNPIITSTVKSSQNITNISITTPSTSPNRTSDLQIFQKGPQVTALVANLPGMEVDNRDMLRTLRPRSSHSNVSSTHITAPDENNQNYKIRHSRHSSSQYARQLEYNSESSSTVDQLRKHHHHHHHHRKSIDPDRHLSRKSITLSESHHNGSVTNKYVDIRSADELDQDSEPSRIQDARSVKSLDFDSEPCVNNNHYAKPLKVHSSRNIDYTSEPINDKKLQYYYHQSSNGELRHSRPKPPKKPIRLSLHRAQSLQSVETPAQLSVPNNNSNHKDDRKPTKRNHKGEAPVISSTTIVKLERPTEQPPQPPPPSNHESKNSDMYSSRSSRNEHNGHSALRWPTSFHHITFSSRNSSSSSNRNHHNGHLSDGGKWC